MSTPIQVDVKDKDVWLTFKSESGRTASLSVASLAEKRGGIVGAALIEWAAETLRDSRHYHVGPDDTCKQCGRDIREAIHRRIEE